MPTISFHSESPAFKLKNKGKLRTWLQRLATYHEGSVSCVQFIFCDDAYLLQLNQDYLQHDTLTDIITFRYQEHPMPLESDIYISVERVQENANIFNTPFEEELYRVMAHGILHLLGFKDKTKTDIQKMRDAEDAALVLYTTL